MLFFFNLMHVHQPGTSPSVEHTQRAEDPTTRLFLYLS